MMHNCAWDLYSMPAFCYIYIILTFFLNTVSNQVIIFLGTDTFFWSIEAFYFHVCIASLEKESQGFPACVYSSCFFIGPWRHWGCQCNETKLTGRKQVVLPSFCIFEQHIRSGADYSTLVQPACEVRNNFPSSVVINNFKFTNVSVITVRKQPLWSTA